MTSNPFGDADDGPVDPFEQSSSSGGGGRNTGKQRQHKRAPSSGAADFNPFRTGDNDDHYDGPTSSLLGGGGDKQQSMTSFAKTKQQQLQKLAQKLRGNEGSSSIHGSAHGIDDEDDEGAGRKLIAQWPYDDYHQVQQKYYEFLDKKAQEADSANSNNNNNSSSSSSSQQPKLPSYMMRPADLPNIPTAVQGLPLVRFGEKAQERAIGIVSTWIFDKGLIDDLLAGGSMASPARLAAARQSKQSKTAAAAAATTTNASVKSSEGMEVGPHGFPMEGSQKMDKEMEMLREKTQRELALINARLNDGVAASGSEVQELVNAVMATKGDLGRLKQLTTYISNGGDLVDGQTTHSYLLTNYPKLKAAMNARRNLERCFRELDFFAQIPATCDRLRQELNACEWTEHEWTTIRDVCREHVELQVFLVEAEAGMKARQEEELLNQQEEEYGGANNHMGYGSGGRDGRMMRQSRAGAGAGGDGRMSNSFRYLPTGSNHDAVDSFLKDHVSNVWSLGDELQFRVLSGIGSAFDLSQQNPAGMVALVEAVEVYENASDEFKRVHGRRRSSNAKNSLAFTDMRRSALEKIAIDFDHRGQEVFQSLMSKAADDAGSTDDETAIFNAILRAANNLTYQIELVKSTMSPCFPPFWNVETLWMTCVAAICSQHILQQIGGQEGNNLDYMTVTQLLDLVAWIESFCQQVETSFPSIMKKAQTAPKTKFVSVKELLAGKEIDMHTARENMGHVVNVLWDIHRLAQDQFIVRTQKQTNEWLENVYNANHAKQQTSDGLLTTSLPEDVWALAGVQLRTIRERLTKKSSVLVDASAIVFRLMQLKQRSTRNRFLSDLDVACAAANDFLRMTEQAEEVLSDLEDQSDLSDDNRGTLEEVANELMRQYSNDAVFAAQSVHKYVFEPIEDELKDNLFGPEWESDLTHNEMALTLVRTIEDYMTDLQEWLEVIMVRKAVDAMVKASINFYLKHLLIKANKKSGRDARFLDNEVALKRIAGDIKVMQDYFESLVDTFPALGRVIVDEFAVLGAVFDLLLIAAELRNGNFVDYLPVLQKRIKNVHVTRMLVGDLYHLVNPAEERVMYEIFAEHDETLRAFDINDTYVDEAYVDPSLQLDRIVIGVVGQSQRRRPIDKEASKALEKLFQKHGVPWNMEIEEEEYEGDKLTDG